MMKGKSILFFGLLLSLGIFFYQESYAFTHVPVALERIQGDSGFSFEVDDDKVYITYNGDQNIDVRYIEFIPRTILRLRSFYETFMIVDSTTGSIVKTFDDFDYVEIDTLDSYEGYITFRTQDDEIRHFLNSSIRAYFIIDKVFEHIVEYSIDSNVDSPVDLNEILHMFIAWDYHDGDVSDSIQIVFNEFTGNETNIGTYDVYIQAEDASQNKAIIDLYIHVKDLTPPIISPLEAIELSYQEILTDPDLFDLVDATDNATLKEALQIDIIANNYQGNESKVGTYEVTFEVKDESGNSTTATQVIHVIDDIPPIITGPNEYEITLQQNLSTQDIIQNLHIEDEINEYVHVYVESSNYVEKLVGLYEVVVAAEDQSGNKTIYPISIQVLDNEPPIFFIHLSQILTTQLNTFSEGELVDLIKERLFFNYDDLTITLNEYEVNAEKPGIYRVQLLATYQDQLTHVQVLVRVNEEEIIEIIEPSPWYTNAWVLTLSGVSLSAVAMGIYVVLKRRRKAF